ncbi:hypothetical protein ABTE85_23260, partial [Acinetobacter baumannii]
RFCNEAERRYITQDLPAGPASSGARPAQGAQVAPMPWLDGINRTRRVPRLETLRQVFTSWNVIGVAIGYGCMIGISNIF